jgi:hypothetical protein
MKIKRRAAVLASIASGIAAVSLTGQAFAASPTNSAGSLSSAEKTLLNSKKPLDVVLSPTTGALQSVRPQSDMHPAISNHNICSSTDGCYVSGQVPWANQGFFGSPGTFRGSWPSRSGYNTGMFTASACWTQACAVRALPPNTHVTFGGGSLVTGTSFTIH